MDSTVKPRPNHYAVLGVKPTASDEEIAQAFISKMFSPRPMADVAHIGAAYEVLRNPAKRRAYDTSLGFREERQGVLSKPVVAFSTRARYVAVAPAITFDPPAIDRPAIDPLAAGPRAEPEVLQQPIPPEPDIGATLADWDEPEREAGSGAFNWRRPAIIVAGLVAAVGLIGAWAGSLAGSDVEAQQVTLALPKPKPAAQAAAPAPAAAVPDAVAALPERPTRTVRRVERRPTGPASGRLDEVSQSLHHSYYQTTGADGTTEIAAADAPAAPALAVDAAAVGAAAAASMPLPNATIARTLHKVGYACGAVASTSAVEGQAGVFDVTCTSGHSYRASPVRGRYHFRRLSN